MWARISSSRIASSRATYNSPLTERLLLEAGYGASISQWNETWQPGVTPDVASVTDVGLGITYGSASTYRGRPDFTNRTTQRFSATYVTGAHTFKAGIQTEQLLTDQFIFANANMSYTFRNGMPIALTQRTTPYSEQDGGYDPAQNLPGSPASKFDQSYPGVQSAPTFANKWIGARSFPRVNDIPNWKDINPRLGVSYDLFGNGRTALKTSIGRYVAKTNVDVSQLLNPINTSVNAASRAWTDANHNFVPDCDLGNFAGNGECGPLNNQFFGQTNPNAISWSAAVRNGWGARDSNWDFSAEIQHELRTGLSLTGGYYRNTGGYY